MPAEATDARPPCVLFVTFEAGAHGPWRWLQDVLADAQFRRSVRPSVWHLEDHYRGAGGKLRLWRHCADRLQREQPASVCIVHDLSAAAWLAPAFRIAGARRVIVHSNAPRFAGVGGSWGQAVRRCMVRWGAHVRAAVSADAAGAMFGSAAAFMPLPACIDFDRLWQQSAAPPETPRGDGYAFGLVGRLVPEKSPLLAIRAFATLVAAGHCATLTLIGDGPLRDACAALADELGVRDRVRIVGTVDHVGAWFRHALDALLVPSQFEAQGRVVAEAQCFGLPVLASPAVPGTAALRPDDIVRVAPADPAAWAAAMLEVSRRPGQREPDLDAARDHPQLSLRAGVRRLLAILDVPPG